MTPRRPTVGRDVFIAPRPECLTQFASSDFVSDFLDGKRSLSEDPRWHEFGFNSIEEYATWAPRLCGIVCLKMIIDVNCDEWGEKNLADLTWRGVELGGYILDDDKGNRVDKGWFYAPLVKLAEEAGMSGDIWAHRVPGDLVSDLDKNGAIVASVHPGVIRGDIEEAPRGIKGGHLVVVIGYRMGTRIEGFFVHNPSGRSRHAQREVFVPFERFGKAFSGRGITLRRAETKV